MKLLESLIKSILLIKAKKINECCSGYLSGNVLDIGSGRCYIAKELQERNGLKVTCLDVNDLSRSGMEVVVYDGKKFPFRNDEFDSALIAYVLHHCDDEISVLKEAMRVCKGNIVIFEDTKPSFVTKLMDFLSNRLRGVETPFKFRTERQWAKLFDELNLKIVGVKRDVEREWFYPLVEHTMVVVRKKQRKGRRKKNVG